MTTITMPQLGETIVEGTILKWLKAEGDRVELDEPLFEISTDKVDTEVPSSVAGTLTKILVPEGATVAVKTPLAEIAEDGAGQAAAPEEATDATTAAAVPLEHHDVVASSAASSLASSAQELPDRGPRSQILSPLVRKLAAEHGVDLSRVAGTGTGGRITKDDVLAFAGSGSTAAGTGVPDAATTSRSAPRTDAALVASGATAPAVRPPGQGVEEIIPVGHIRRLIAQHMKQSLEVSARAWNAVEVNMENVARLREKAQDAFREREGFGLTYMPFVSRAVCDALLEYPMVNGELRGEEIVVRHFVNLGIAVSYEDGLIVPVVRNADSMNMVGLARAINDVATRARAKKLHPDEVHGGTFTITNPGPFGSLISVPIINQPQTAILGFDTVEKRPVVINDAIAIRHMVYLSMSWDHRVIDGALASQFLARLKTNLETWDFAEDLGV
jgi:pyruvate dehydrogenase E2 component (dihydrolipoamide acetyltransferase)